MTATYETREKEEIIHDKYRITTLSQKQKTTTWKMCVKYQNTKNGKKMLLAYRGQESNIEETNKRLFPLLIFQKRTVVS